MSEMIKGYYVLKTGEEYARETPEITFGLYEAHGRGTSGEMIMKWIELIGETLPQLHIFDDAFITLETLGPEFVAKLAQSDGRHMHPEEFVQDLDDLGFTNMAAWLR